MKKALLFLLSWMVVGQLATAQNTVQPHCFTDEYYRESIATNPDILRVQGELEDFTRQYVKQAKQNRTQSTTPPTYIIPVVFHVLHQYGGEYISDAQIIDCINHMNEDFRKLNPDTINIVPSFIPIAADCQIEFRLASIDPNGNCTTGIDRIYTDKTNSANNNSKLNPWPNNKYLNIWTAKTLENTGAAAYSQYPGSVIDAYDGIMSLYTYVGTIGAGGPSGAHTISHEAGHYLNLQHPWGSTNSPGVACGDDQVQDTPETQGWTSCNLTGAICNPPVIENVQNFMEYSYCDNMFTYDQRDRMHAALNSPISGRNNLWSNANLIATGTLNPPTAICSPIADFWATTQSICEGRYINFKDFTWNGHPTSWTWYCPGGTPSLSNDSNPVIQYNTAGVYDVSLVVTNAGGTDSITRTGFIRVSGTAGNPTPFLTTFDAASDFPGTNGWVYNPDAGTTTWTRVTTTGANGSSSCIRMNNYTNTSGQIDEWVTPPYDVSNLTGASFKFYVANAQRNSTSEDLLRVYLSTSCGETWTPKFTKQGATLATGGIVATSFTPSATQWRQESFNLTGFAPRTNVRFKFQNVSDRGNNTYIDDVEITGTPNNADEIDEVTTGFGLYPNPSQGASTIQFKLNSPQRVRIQLLDITGRMVEQILDQDMSAELHEVAVKTTIPGVYMIDLVTNGKHHVRRWVVAD